MPWKEVLEALSVIRVLCPSPVPLTVPTHDAAQARCGTLYSEDLKDGQVIEGLTIRNAFA